MAVIDTGIDFEHADLNVVAGVNCMSGNPNRPKCVDGGDDDQYHGTHVAGTIGALDNEFGVVGIAPGARLWAVKVLDSNGSGSFGTLIAGIDYVAANASQIEVANMSLGCDNCSSSAMDSAISNTVAAGVTFVVAAGNSGIDAANTSPANHPDVITVSALTDFDGLPGGLRTPTCLGDQDDTLAYFSNYGSDVEITAPGVCIYSTFPIERNGYGTISGTSMASPHVAGAAALLAASGSYSPAQIRSTLIGAGNQNWTDDSGDGIQEPLLDVSNGALFAPAMVAGAGATPNAAPVVTINTPLDNYNYSSGVTIGFWGSATDPEDGSVNASMVWTSSLDGQIGTGSSFEHAPSDGTHVITAVATDSDGLSSSTSVTIIVGTASEPPAEPTPDPTPDPEPTPDPTPDPGTGDFTASASGFKNKGKNMVNLTWEGASSAQVDIYRDGVKIMTTDNDGLYIDATETKGGQTFIYQVCEAGTSVCSNEVTVIF